MKNPAAAYARAVRTYRDLARQGNAEAQFMLGHMYEEGRGLPKNMPEALRWYTRAGENGWPEAVLRLGISHANGKGVPKSLVKAYAFFVLADSLGNPRAPDLMEKIGAKLTDEERQEARDMAEAGLFQN